MRNRRCLIPAFRRGDVVWDECNVRHAGRRAKVWGPGLEGDLRHRLLVLPGARLSWLHPGVCRHRD